MNMKNENMKRKNLTAAFRATAFCAAVLLLAGCGNDNAPAAPDGGDTRVPLEVTGGISDWTSGNGTGEEGDAQ